MVASCLASKVSFKCMDHFLGQSELSSAVFLVSKKQPELLCAGCVNSVMKPVVRVLQGWLRLAVLCLLTHQ